MRDVPEGAVRRTDGEGGEEGAGGADRRRCLTTGAGIVFSTALGAAGMQEAAAAPGGRGKGRPKKGKGPKPRPPRRGRRVVVLVIDGCRPDELNTRLTPNLTALARGGTWFPNARSLPVMETIPNHVMMMTGVRPDRSGVPANSIYDRRLREVRDMDRPGDIKVRTLIERANRAGLRTGTVLSKTYLYGVFGARATHRWEPSPTLPVTDHAPDVFTMDATTAMIEEFDPHLTFVNLGDIDRFGHADFTGQSVQLSRRLALASTDRMVGDFVQMLKRRGTWDQTMLVVLADHSMDWSGLFDVISLQDVMDADPLLAGRVQIAQNGGADLLYWTGPAQRRAAAIERMVRLADATEGVLVAHPRTRRSLRLGPEAGDVVVYAKAGWRFSDPTPVSNPIPGNHGHPATQAIPFFLSGGHPAIRRRTSPLRATTVDVAPTIATFLRVPGAPRGGYDGRPLI